MPASNVYIHLTDFCNQNCSFCFAREEMTSANKKQIDYEDFKKKAMELKKMGVLKLDFLGGEPTLHSEFGKILRFALKHFFMVRIYTNGIFSKKVKEILLLNSKRVNLIVNISTPGFILNKGVRGLVLSNIDYLSPKVDVTLSVVNIFMNQSAAQIFTEIPKKIIKKTAVKLSFMTPAVNDKNPIKINDFPKVGKNLIGVFKKIEKLGPPLQIRFNKMFRPCMFAKNDINFLKKNGVDFVAKNVMCHSESENTDLFHITSDLSTFKCYPLSTVDIFSAKTLSLVNLQKKYEDIKDKRTVELVLPECKKCPFFGYEKNKCSGPCMAFRINALRGGNTIPKHS